MKQLSALQRFILLSILPVNSTCSTDALRVLAGRRRLEHEVQLMSERYLAKLHTRPLIHYAFAMHPTRDPSFSPPSQRGPRPRFRRGLPPSSDPCDALNISPEVLVTSRDLVQTTSELMESWQSQWSICPNGEITRIFFPRVEASRPGNALPSCRLKRPSLAILSGHEPFRAKLFSLNLSDSPLCRLCSVPDT